MKEPCLSGTSVLSSLQSLEEMVGRQVVDRAMNDLPEADRDAYRAAKEGDWIPVRIADDVQRAVAHEAGIPVDQFVQFVREFSHRSVSRTVTTAWKLLLRLTSDKALIERTPQFYESTYNIGKMTAQVPAPGRGIVTLSEWPDISEEQMIGTAGGIEAVLQAAGRKDVKIKWKRNAAGVRYTVQWAV